MWVKFVDLWPISLELRNTLSGHPGNQRVDVIAYIYIGVSKYRTGPIQSLRRKDHKANHWLVDVCKFNSPNTDYISPATNLFQF